MNSNTSFTMVKDSKVFNYDIIEKNNYSFMMKITIRTIPKENREPKKEIINFTFNLKDRHTLMTSSLKECYMGNTINNFNKIFPSYSDKRKVFVDKNYMRYCMDSIFEIIETDDNAGMYSLFQDIMGIRNSEYSNSLGKTIYRLLTEFPFLETLYRAKILTKDTRKIPLRDYSVSNKVITDTMTVTSFIDNRKLTKLNEILCITQGTFKKLNKYDMDNNLNGTYSSSIASLMTFPLYQRTILYNNGDMKRFTDLSIDELKKRFSDMVNYSEKFIEEINKFSDEFKIHKTNLPEISLFPKTVFEYNLINILIGRKINPRKFLEYLFLEDHNSKAPVNDVFKRASEFIDYHTLNTKINSGLSSMLNEINRVKINNKQLEKTLKQMSIIYNKRFRNFPKDIRSEHDILAMNLNGILNSRKYSLYPERYNYHNAIKNVSNSFDRRFKHIKFSMGNYILVLPRNEMDIIYEGSELHHCAAAYIDSVSNGSSGLAFIRSKTNRNKPLYTIEFNPLNGDINEIAGFANEPIDYNNPDNEGLKEFIQALKKYLNNAFYKN